MAMRLTVKPEARKIIAVDIARSFRVPIAQARAWVNDGPLPARFTDLILDNYKDPSLYFDIAEED